MDKKGCFSKQLSEEELLLERTNPKCGSRTPRESAVHKTKPNLPSYLLPATLYDTRSPWTLTDTPKSTPLMALSAEYTDSSPRENLCVRAYIPDPNLVSEEPTGSTIVDLSESSPVYILIDVPEADSCVVVDIPGRPELSGHLFHLLVLISWCIMQHQIRKSRWNRKTTEVP